MITHIGSAVRPDSAISHLSPAELPPLIPRPPRWVDLLLGDTRRVSVYGTVQVAVSGGLAQFSHCITDAADLSVEQLRARVTEAYVALGEAMSTFRRHPVRFWNFLPAPGELMGPGLDRYMVFNAGRYDAYARSYGTARAFSDSLATASAVGVGSNDLAIFCLALDMPGTPIENPRQTPSWHYSTRYGPKPPCFARATIVTLEHERRVLIGGTASIVGEDSRHVGDPEEQVDETLTNLRALIAAARGADKPAVGDIARLIDVRVHVPRSNDAALIRSMIETQCLGLTHLEMCHSQLCRPELLVEIEGVAAL